MEPTKEKNPNSALYVIKYFLIFFLFFFFFNNILCFWRGTSQKAAHSQTPTHLFWNQVCTRVSFPCHHGHPSVGSPLRKASAVASFNGFSLLENGGMGV